MHSHVRSKPQLPPGESRVERDHAFGTLEPDLESSRLELASSPVLLPDILEHLQGDRADTVTEISTIALDHSHVRYVVLVKVDRGIPVPRQLGLLGVANKSTGSRTYL